jgi:hypothetical protein
MTTSPRIAERFNMLSPFTVLPLGFCGILPPESVEAVFQLASL